MEKRKIIGLFGFLFILVLVFLPGYSKFQELAQRNRVLGEKVRRLEISNKDLRNEITHLEQDHTYVEKVAREKLKVSKKGEIIYKLVEEEPEGERKNR